MKFTPCNVTVLSATVTIYSHVKKQGCGYCRHHPVFKRAKTRQKEYPHLLSKTERKVCIALNIMKRLRDRFYLERQKGRHSIRMHCTRPQLVACKFLSEISPL